MPFITSAPLVSISIARPVISSPGATIFTRLFNVAESLFHSSSNLFSVSKARCLAISFNREFKSCFLEISFLNSSFSEVAVFSYWEMEVLAFMPIPRLMKFTLSISASISANMPHTFLPSIRTSLGHFNSAFKSKAFLIALATATEAIRFIRGAYAGLIFGLKTRVK